MPIKPAFSAVELLLVAGISAILVAIAVPGYLDAKVRAEVVDVKWTLKVINDGLIQYHLESSDFPEAPSMQSPKPLLRLYDGNMLTQEPVDRFKKGLKGMGGFYDDVLIGYDYIDPNNRLYRGYHARLTAKVGVPRSSYNSKYWILKSIGPDQTDFRDEAQGRLSGVPNEMGVVDYDPTNGTFSLGEITRSQYGVF
ncbi:MAG: hypothetical protein GC154_03330 [bacterium]|nr:hypothetical protein [bacterium]